MMNDKGIIFNIQKFSIHDGPGIRTMVFFKGCPLRCLWCSNPESQNPLPELLYMESNCVKCGRCIDKCPQKAITKVDHNIIINRQVCNNCGLCARSCLNGALTMVGKTMRLDEVIAEIEKDRPYYRRSGGGVTLSGGEALLQAPFAKMILERSQSLGINTAIETSGYQRWDLAKDVLGHVDTVFYDIKEMDPSRHKTLTGYDNALILENARKISDTGIPAIIRMPIVPGVNAGEESLRLFGEFVSELKNIKKIELLPYHQLGANKYKALGYSYQLPDIKSPTGQYMETVAGTIKKNTGVLVEIGG